VQEVAAESVSRYGIVAGADAGEGAFEVTDVVEKPSLRTAPSRIAIMGRYVLGPAVFEALQDTPAGTAGEVQLSDAPAG
jgi:UTP--glucose-1-phosphate uridylyltransferase